MPLQSRRTAKSLLFALHFIVQFFSCFRQFSPGGIIGILCLLYSNLILESKSACSNHSVVTGVKLGFPNWGPCPLGVIKRLPGGHGPWALAFNFFVRSNVMQSFVKSLPTGNQKISQLATENWLCQPSKLSLEINLRFEIWNLRTMMKDLMKVNRTNAILQQKFRGSTSEPTGLTKCIWWLEKICKFFPAPRAPDSDGCPGIVSVCVASVGWEEQVSTTWLANSQIYPLTHQRYENMSIFKSFNFRIFHTIAFETLQVVWTNVKW